MAILIYDYLLKVIQITAANEDNPRCIVLTQIKVKNN